MERDLSDPIIFDVENPASSILNFLEYRVGLSFSERSNISVQMIRIPRSVAYDQNLGCL
jgi:hypothetical protein